MAEYIDKRKISEYRYSTTDKEVAVAVANLLNYILSIPSADVEQVVRCKDCKWYNIFRLECYKPHRNGVSWIDDFCSSGERRTDDD